ncbi:MAG: DUF2277 domain-containing protein [Sandaracinus sp.]
MCRNIKLLFHFDPPATDEEMRASALQYVRKVSGFVRPAENNREAFERAVDEITAITRRLLMDELEPKGAPKSREHEKARAKLRGQAREARMRAKILGEG